jgi:hypothetical protein
VFDIEYDKEANVMSYSVQYDEIDIVDSRFTYDDVEYYAIRGSDGRVGSLYYNSIQEETMPSSDKYAIVDGKFNIDGVDYLIEDGRVRVNATGVDGSE